jgi:hypothetical protein
VEKEQGYFALKKYRISFKRPLNFHAFLKISTPWDARKAAEIAIES